MKRRYSVFYAGWIAICATLFLALLHAPDPSRRSGRLLNNDAGEIATRIVAAQGPEFRRYEVVHIAYASRGEVGAEPRWVVLVDAVPHTALRKAVVVELRASDGKLLRIRRPE